MKKRLNILNLITVLSHSIIYIYIFVRIILWIVSLYFYFIFKQKIYIVCCYKNEMISLFLFDQKVYFF